MTKAILAVCMLATCAIPARAWDGCGHDYGYGYGLGYLYGTLQYNVPHFAAFPPVYYSYPVPRTYGYSPFAYPPGIMTPEIVEAVEPQIIENPHVPSSTSQPKAKSVERKDPTVAKPAASEPLVILNPFVTESVAAR